MVTGKDRMAMSVRMFGTAFPMNDPFKLMQWPGTVGSHAFLTGIHWKTLTQMMAMDQDIAMLPKMYAAMRNWRVGKILAYIKRMAILMTLRVVA